MTRPSRSAAAPAASGGVAEPLLAAISLGAVFLGAMTYIGNGPNFMVRAMAQRAGVRMPGFFGYMAYSCLILLPLLVLMEVLFLRQNRWKMKRTAKYTPTTISTVRRSAGPSGQPGP